MSEPEPQTTEPELVEPEHDPEPEPQPIEPEPGAQSRWIKPLMLRAARDDHRRGPALRIAGGAFLKSGLRHTSQ